MKPDWFLKAIAEDEGDLPYGEKIRAALTPDEYQTLLAYIKEAAKKKRRPPKVDVMRVGNHCLHRKGSQGVEPGGNAFRIGGHPLIQTNAT